MLSALLHRKYGLRRLLATRCARPMECGSVGRSCYRRLSSKRLGGPSAGALRRDACWGFVLIVGFPLCLNDSLHHLPCVRQGVIAPAFGLKPPSPRTRCWR